ncbi:MAG TPA: hypothetical protein VNU97_07080 [Rhizomicrobium sp.]|jgi:hypothetical protein|nr:hypothetical protein [Rhizomicrobium sp.]
MKIVRATALAALMLLPSAAGAGPRDDLIDGMAKCAAVADNGARLACYDALNPQLKAAQAEPVPPPAPPAPPPAVADNRPWYDPGRIFGVSPGEQTTPQQFGGENLAAPPPPPGTPAAPQNAPPPELDSITVGVTDYSFNPYQKFLVILDNGQIWQQLESDSGIAHFDKHGKNTVTISRGFIGSYNLEVNDGSAIFKVKRLK